MAEPYSPCLATTTRGPISSSLRAARTRFGSSVSWRTSPSLRITQSTIPIVRTSDSWAMSIHRFIESSAVKCSPRTARAPRAEDRAGCWRGTACPRLGGLGELRLEVLEDVEVGLQRVADVDVALVAARPEERLAARDVLDVVGVDPAGVQHGELLLAEVVADRADHVGVGEERGGQREVHRGAAEQASRLPVCVSTASNAMDPTTVRPWGEEGIVRRRARDPDLRMGRPRGTRARRGRPGARARRRRGAGPRLARGDELRRHPRKRELLPRPLRAAADARAPRWRA